MCVDAVCGSTSAAVTFHVTLQVTCEGQMKPQYKNWTQIFVTVRGHRPLVLITVFKIYPGCCFQCMLRLHSRATESIYTSLGLKFGQQQYTCVCPCNTSAFGFMLFENTPAEAFVQTRRWQPCVSLVSFSPTVRSRHWQLKGFTCSCAVQVFCSPRCVVIKGWKQHSQLKSAWFVFLWPHTCYAALYAWSILGMTVHLWQLPHPQYKQQLIATAGEKTYLKYVKHRSCSLFFTKNNLNWRLDF